MLKKIFIFLIFIFLQACVSLNGDETHKEMPKITLQMPLSEVISIGIDFGEQSLPSVKRYIAKKKDSKQAADLLSTLILSKHNSLAPHKLINAFRLYQDTADQKAPEVFAKTVRSERALAVQLSWHIAAQLPSKTMSKQIETVLTEAIIENDIDRFFLPEMAEAVAANDLKDSYTLIRQGLFLTHHPAYAKALSSLNPSLASDDFLDYLNLASIEELRQLNMKSVDPLTCSEILTHFSSKPPSIHHSKINVLFLFAVSRNAALSGLAKNIIDSYLPEHGPTLAAILAKEASWLQLAYIEGLRRQYTSVSGLFLQDLKAISAQQDVLDEIDQVLR